MAAHCAQLALLLKMEREIIEKHIETHKWFRHIADYNQGVADFIGNYGWLMREMYCSHICSDRQDCLAARELKQSQALKQTTTSAASVA